MDGKAPVAIIDLAALLLSGATIKDSIPYDSMIAMASAVGTAAVLGYQSEHSEISVVSRDAVRMYALAAANRWGFDIDGMQAATLGFAGGWKYVAELQGTVYDLFRWQEIEALTEVGVFITGTHAIRARQDSIPVYMTASHSLFELRALLAEL